MKDRYIGRIVPGEEVCDVNGEKIGSVARVYREDTALMEAAEPSYEDIVEVKTGPFGLGRHLYVPVGAV